MPADDATNRAIILKGRDHRSRLQIEISSPDIFYLDPMRFGVTQADLSGIVDIGSQWAYRRQTAACAPLFEILQRDGIQSHGVFARILRSMMNRIVRLGLRATGILRNEPVHQIENHLLCDDWIGVDFRQTFRAETRALGKATPVIDVGNCHIINATRDSIRFTDAHYRNVNDLVYFSGNDLREMTHVARVLGIG